jgi:hypothetical protein
MAQVTYDPAAPIIVVDLLLESADGTSSLLIPVVLDTGASFTVVATDVLVQLGYDPANPLLARQRVVTGNGIDGEEISPACHAITPIVWHSSFTFQRAM